MTIPVGESFKEFTALFHNRQIRTVIGIKDIINTDFFERADQLAHGRVLILETNLLSPRGTHRRSHLYDGDDFRIRERVVEIQSVISFAQRADRTMRDALPAKRAVAFAEGLIIFEPDGRAVAGTCSFASSLTSISLNLQKADKRFIYSFSKDCNALSLFFPIAINLITISLHHYSLEYLSQNNHTDPKIISSFDN